MCLAETVYWLLMCQVWTHRLLHLSFFYRSLGHSNMYTKFREFTMKALCQEQKTTSQKATLYYSGHLTPWRILDKLTITLPVKKTVHLLRNLSQSLYLAQATWFSPNNHILVLKIHFNPLQPNGNYMSHLLQKQITFAVCVCEFCKLLYVNHDYFLK
jgi:hypothetical protein